MDIIDVILGKALSSQGRIESYAAQSQTAVAKANQAVSDIESITEQTNENNAKAAETLETLEAATAELNSALEDVDSMIDEKVVNAINNTELVTTLNQVKADAEKAKEDAAEALKAAQSGSSISIEAIDASTPAAKITKHRIKQGNKTTDLMVEKNYTSSGKNEDGSMTQKAITAYVDSAKSELTTKINNIKTIGGGGSGISNLGIDNEGRIVIIGPDGTIQPGAIQESDIIDALIKSGSYDVEGTLGLVIDYDNKETTRGQEAKDKMDGAAFDVYPMYGGRMRCNVADDGTITAFYGDANYKEDGSNGQVMVYQPKFYYQRTIFSEEPLNGGNAIRKESLILSAEENSGLKLHPLFDSVEGELEYVLTPAYEGSLYSTNTSTYVVKDDITPDTTVDKLSSIANVKPLNGAGKSLSIDDLRALAANRGEGWSLTNLQFESAMQMLETVEFGTLNGQDALGKGVVNITMSNAIRAAAVTGSTSSLGNASGVAASTIFDNNGTQTTQTALDARAISYRGMENPWGNLWRVIDNFIIKGNGTNQGGIPYVNDVSLQFNLPDASSAWVSSMGYADSKYDWVYMPIERNGKANSALPVGDTLWTLSNLNDETLVSVGGYYTAKEAAGAFNYACDMKKSMNLNHANGRLMFTPSKNSIYEANIAKWKAHFGG